MKARLPVNNKMRKRIQEETARIVDQQFEKQSVIMTRKLFKLMCISLNEKFGFGKKRLSCLINEISETIKESEKDIIFWEHADKIVIDQIGLPFERDYTEQRGN